MATAVAIALKQQQNNKQENLYMQQQKQLDTLERGVSNRDENSLLLRRGCENAIDALEDVKSGFEAGYKRTDEVVIDIDDLGVVGGCDRALMTAEEQQQTCPVDLSTNNTSKGCFVSYNSSETARKKSQVFVENKQHCAATLCDLCINTIMKNRLENAKKRLFVFPQDSPGFEVFAPVNNCLNPKEHEKFISNNDEKTSERNVKVNPFNPFARVQNLREADVIIKKENDSEIWTVQENISLNTFSNYKTTKIQNTPLFKSPTSHNNTPKTQISNTLAQPYNLTATKPSTDAVNVTSSTPPHVNSTTVIKNPPITDTVLTHNHDSDSSSSSDSVFLCPSCHCDGECSKLQTESEYRNSLKSKSDSKLLTADEIRAQMRQLFVQLAELEPHVANDNSSRIDCVNVDGEVKGGLNDFVEESSSKCRNVERTRSVMSDSSLESFGNYLDNVQDYKITQFAMCRKNMPSSSATVEDELSLTRLTKLNEVCRESFPFVEYNPNENLTSQFANATNLLNQKTPVKDISSTTTSKYTGCSNKPLEFQNQNEQSQIGIIPSSNGKLIDAPTPEGSFIEGATAPVENDSEMTAKSAEEEYISQAVEQHRLIQLHCKHDTALAENMNVLYEMGFRNFYGNLQRLKAHENNIVLVLEQLLPRF